MLSCVCDIHSWQKKRLLTDYVYILFKHHLIISPTFIFVFPIIYCFFLCFFCNSFSFCFQELHGLKAIIKYVYKLPSNKKNVPELITDPILLIKDVRTLIELHCHDNPHEAITGRPVLPPQVRFNAIFFFLCRNVEG